MNPLAIELNKKLENSVIGDLLSDMGKRFYFPRGIVSQSAEAAEHAHRFNATVGIAKKGKKPINLSVIRDILPQLDENEIFPYAPTPGVPELRKLWKEEMVKKNPSLDGKATTLPLVTTGITNGISLLADMFFSKGEEIIVPDMFWGNYTLIFTARREAKIVQFPLFANEGFNIEGFKAILEKQAQRGDKISLLLNFPNNPTGYTPSEEEVMAIVSTLKEMADRGKKLLVILDDAYFNLFYEEATCKQSLFGLLADLHPNLLTIKLDGATKEDFVWGFRLGFITYAVKGFSEEAQEAITKKTMGIIRASVSNSNRLGQSLLFHAIKADTYLADKQQAFLILKNRYLKMKEVLSRLSNPGIVPLPFNSGYFMCFKLESIDSEELRKYLLHEKGIGSISIQGKYLRIAYSSVNLDDIEECITEVYKAVENLSK